MDVGSIFNVNITEYKSTFCNYSFLTDSGGVRFNNGPPTKIKTPHEEEEDGKYFFLFQLNFEFYLHPSAMYVQVSRQFEQYETDLFRKVDCKLFLSTA